MIVLGSMTRASCIEDVRSQSGHYSGKVSTRSLADGQSQHSFSNNSTRYFANAALTSNLVSTRPGLYWVRWRFSRACDCPISNGLSTITNNELIDNSYHVELRQSRQSLAATSDRMSRSNFSGNHLPPHSSARRQRPRSRNRVLETNPPRPGSRYSLADSTHTLNNYDENNWTDHDMDIYMARNPTTRSGLVPL